MPPKAPHPPARAKQSRDERLQAAIPATVKVESFLAANERPLDPPVFNAFSQLQPDDFIIHNGTRREGKSWLERFFLYTQRNKYRCGEVFTGTKENGFWQKYFPEWKVISGWRPGMMKAIIEEQRRAAELYIEFGDRINPYRIVVLDDIANKLTHDSILEELAQSGRHIYLSIHVLTQHPQKLSPIVRSNADVATVFRMHNRAALQCLADDYLPMLDSHRAKEVLTSYAWKNKKKVAQAIVIVNRDGNTIHERLHTIVAPDPGPFQIGCEEYLAGEQSLPSDEEIERWRKEEGRDGEEEEEEDDSLSTCSASSVGPDPPSS